MARCKDCKSLKIYERCKREKEYGCHSRQCPDDIWCRILSKKEIERNIDCNGFKTNFIQRLWNNLRIW